jgi:hypothetical protein
MNFQLSFFILNFASFWTFLVQYATEYRIKKENSNRLKRFCPDIGTSVNFFGMCIFNFYIEEQLANHKGKFGSLGLFWSYKVLKLTFCNYITFHFFGWIFISLAVWIYNMYHKQCKLFLTYIRHKYRISHSRIDLGLRIGPRGDLGPSPQG